MNPVHFAIVALTGYLVTNTTPTTEQITFQDVASLAVTDETRVGFRIEFDGVSSDLSINSATVMPGEMLSISADADMHANSGHMEQIDDTSWQWKAPDRPGHHEIYFTRNGETSLLNVFVLTPFENGQDDDLSGYRIGQYNPTPMRGLERYIPPTGFIHMEPGMEDIQIAPHFRLGQFICKQQPGFENVFLMVDPSMLLKLETLLAAANERGWEADTFFVMSGFRTPFYNAAIGNTTTSSRHLFGDAADIYIDNDQDGVMDDLDGDGRITRDDAVALASLAGELAEADPTNWPNGGIGIYNANAVHGPFVHIDARGYRARW